MLKIGMMVVDKRSFNGFGSREFIIESESDIERVRKYANNKRKTKGIMHVELINDGVITQYRVCDIENCLEDAENILNPPFELPINVTLYESIEAKEHYVVCYLPEERVTLCMYSISTEDLDKKIRELLCAIQSRITGSLLVWANKWNCANMSNSPEFTIQQILEAIEDTSRMIGTFVIDNVITYHTDNHKFDGHEIIELVELEKAFNDSEVWDLSLIKRLCDKADMSLEYNVSDGDNIEELIYNAAEKVGIRI